MLVHMIWICVQNYTDMSYRCDLGWTEFTSLGRPELICKATLSVGTPINGDVRLKVTILSQQAWKTSA